MRKIVSYEKARTTKWVRLFFGIIIVLLSVSTIAIVFTIKQMIDFQVFDMLSLFQEDREIIAEFWQDVLSTVWVEMPQQIVIAALAAILLIIMIIILTRSRRRIINKKLSELAKYRENK